jgi:hypothetical protein
VLIAGVFARRVSCALAATAMLVCVVSPATAATNTAVVTLWSNLWDSSDTTLPDDATMLCDLFNTAEDQVARRRVGKHKGPCLYVAISDELPSNVVEDFMYDSIPGDFLMHAGLCYILGSQKGGNQADVRDSAARHGKEALRIAALPRGFAIDSKRLAFLYQDLAQVSAGEEKDEYSRRSFELFPGDNLLLSRMKAYYAWRLHQRGKHEESAELYEDLFAKSPFTFHYIFGQAGRMYADRADYRKAFATWLTGLRDMNPAAFNSCAQDIVREIMTFLPYATLDELRSYRSAVRYQAARCPAITEKVSDIAQWLRLADDERILFEITLREAEERGDPDVTNLLHQALAKYRHPVYAEKLGDYFTLADIYCEEMHKEKFPLLYANMTPCAAQKLHALFTGGKMDKEHIRLYRDTLKARADKYRDDTKLINQERVKLIDQRVARIEKSNPWLNVRSQEVDD